MRCKITKTQMPFYDKYQDNQLITFDYFDRTATAIVTKKARQFLKVHLLIEGQLIEVVKNVRGSKIVYVVTKVY